MGTLSFNIQWGFSLRLGLGAVWRAVPQQQLKKSDNSRKQFDGPKTIWWSKKKIDGPKTVENNSKAVVAGLRGGKLVHFPTKKNKYSCKW